MITENGHFYQNMYLPNPLCSSDENVTIASKTGAFLARTSLENSTGEISVIFGCLHG